MQSATELDPISPGVLLAGRFRVVGPVGRGGMGLVYEAIDEKLDRRVALKFARAGHSRHLPPEARAAREVSHFNVCKVHDLHTAATPSGEVEFLSMEYIEGETLADRIHNKGPLTPAEALGIARQICAGLAQAHQQGVIHGDLKCANVLLTQSANSGGPNLRAVVTDFGLARLTSDPASTRGGTRDYMAPELFLGGWATAASDIYALGVLFHVMLTGHAPQRIEPNVNAPSPTWHPNTEASTQIQDPAIADAQWKRQTEPLPAPWNRIVARCLAPQPAHRFASAADVSAALAPRRWFLIAAAALVLVTGLALAYGAWRNAAPPAGPPVRLAVLPIVTAGDAVQAASGIGLDIVERLSHGQRSNFLVISPREAELNRVDTPDRARKILGATHVLTTRLQNAGNNIRVDASIQDLASNRQIGHLASTYSSAEPSLLAKAILATVTGSLHLRSGVPQESVAPAAYSYYVQGVDLLQRHADLLKAITSLKQAITLDPRSALPYARLADAYLERFTSGEDAQALSLADAAVRKAVSLNADSVPVLLAAGTLNQQLGRYEEAVHQFSRAVELEPANAEASRRLARAYEVSNHPEEALETYRRAINTQPGYYAPYFDLGNFHLQHSEFREAETFFRQAVRLAPEFTSAHTNLGLALFRLQRLPEAEQELLTSLHLRRTANVLVNLGALYYEQERYAEALALFEESITAGAPTSIRYRNIGDASRQLKHTKQAAGAYRHAWEIAEADLARNPRNTLTRAQLAVVAAFLGDARRAESELSQALALDPENTLILRNAIVVREALGQREQSLQLLRTAPPRLLQELNYSPDLKELRRDSRFQELLRRGTTQ